jgi:hypothetical protein
MMKSKPLTHKRAVNLMLKNAAVKAEVQRLNKEEFAIFDETLKARKVAGLSQAEVARRISTQGPAVARLES